MKRYLDMGDRIELAKAGMTVREQLEFDSLERK